jgi:molybdopterin synthase catalytic subunit
LFAPLFYSEKGLFVFSDHQRRLHVVQLIESPIDPSAIYGFIQATYSGSVVLHYAVVKQQAGSGKSTVAIEYRAAGGTVAELETIAAELKQSGKLEDVLLIRRTGCLVVGDIISLVAVSAPGSEEAFEACKAGISRLKKMKTITKTEKFDEI